MHCAAFTIRWYKTQVDTTLVFSKVQLCNNSFETRRLSYKFNSCNDKNHFDESCTITSENISFKFRFDIGFWCGYLCDDRWLNDELAHIFLNPVTVSGNPRVNASSLAVLWSEAGDSDLDTVSKYGTTAVTLIISSDIINVERKYNYTAGLTM